MPGKINLPSAELDFNATRTPVVVIVAATTLFTFISTANEVSHTPINTTFEVAKQVTMSFLRSFGRAPGAESLVLASVFLSILLIEDEVPEIMLEVFF